MEIFKGQNILKFAEQFKTDQDCREYLSEIKWESGYNCKRCGNDKFGNGKNPQNRRCTKCRYDESPITDTMFDKINSRF